MLLSLDSSSSQFDSNYSFCYHFSMKNPIQIAFQGNIVYFFNLDYSPESVFAVKYSGIQHKTKASDIAGWQRTGTIPHYKKSQLTINVPFSKFKKHDIMKQPPKPRPSPFDAGACEMLPLYQPDFKSF